MTPSPVALAQQDWRNGSGQSDNPFVVGTVDHSNYAWEMHPLCHEEFLRDCMDTYEQAEAHFHSQQ